MKTWYERAKEAMALKGVTQAKLSEALGIAQPTVSAKLRGNRDASSEEVAQFAKVLGVSPSWLAYGDADSSPQQQSIDLSSHPDLLDIPRVKFKLSAGVSGFAVEQDEGNGKPIFFRRDWFESHGYRNADLFAVRVSGKSMEPTLWEEDLVVINTADINPSDGDVFAINYEGELVIKRLRRDGGEWRATSDNPDQIRFAPKRCTEDVKIIGKAIYKQSERF